MTVVSKKFYLIFIEVDEEVLNQQSADHIKLAIVDLRDAIRDVRGHTEVYNIQGPNFIELRDKFRQAPRTV